MQRFACLIDGNGAFSLAGAADGGNFSAKLRQRGDQLPRRANKGAPPIFRILLGAILTDDVQSNRAEGPLPDNSVQPDQGTFATRGSQVDGEDKSVVTRRPHGLSCLFDTARSRRTAVRRWRGLFAFYEQILSAAQEPAS